MRRPRPTTASAAFDRVRHVGLTLADVQAGIRYDGSPVLTVRGCFVAGLATHVSAEPETLVVRSAFEDRQWLVDDAPETYYLTSYYEKYPVVLVRLGQVTEDALHDLLAVSRQMACEKAPKRPLRPPPREW